MKQSHYEFPKSTNTSGDQYLLFDIHSVDNNTGDVIGITLTKEQIEELRQRRRTRARIEAQLALPESQPSVSRRAGSVALQNARRPVGYYPSN